ncbi:MAG TPA: chemotaxis protein CheB [Polyangia bacterium]
MPRCFFLSLADDARERAVAIVLSGTGTDGTLGIKKCDCKRASRPGAEPGGNAEQALELCRRCHEARPHRFRRTNPPATIFARQGHHHPPAHRAAQAPTGQGGPPGPLEPEGDAGAAFDDPAELVVDAAGKDPGFGEDADACQTE